MQISTSSAPLEPKEFAEDEVAKPYKTRSSRTQGDGWARVVVRDKVNRL